MGEQDVSGTNRLISTQPHMGSFFKSQNNTTWNAVQSQDLKFTMRKAVFPTDTIGVVSLGNNNLSTEKTDEENRTIYGQRLLANPLVMTNSNTTVKVNHRDHGMYSTANNVSITGVSSDVSTTLNGRITSSSTSLTLTSSTGFPSSGTVTLRIRNLRTVRIGQRDFPTNTEIVSGTISGTTVSSLTRGVGDTTANDVFNDGAIVELYQINGVPLTEINKTHTAIGNIGIDSYTITVSSTPSVAGASGDAEVGGINVFASENYRFETMKTSISAMELKNTGITAAVRTTTATSPSGSETSFSLDSTSKAKIFTLNENFNFEISRLVASKINQDNEMSASKSLFVDLALATTNANLSPVIDLDRASVALIANRLNQIDSSSDVYPTSDFNAMTEPDGDQNASIYLTKGIALENPATSIKLFFAGHKKNSADIKVLFKTLPAASASGFDDIGYTFFNTDGSADVTPKNSLTRDDFQEYLYTAGVTDEGVGDPLEEFIQFQIKIVMQGTNAAEVPRIKDLRILALAT